MMIIIIIIIIIIIKRDGFSFYIKPNEVYSCLIKPSLSNYLG